MFSNSLILDFKVSKNDFTRKRKQTFSNTVLFMMNFLTKSLSIEIDNFISFLKDRIGFSDTQSFTKSAFVQRRKKIKPELFKHLSDNLIKEFYTDNDDAIQLWKGFRLLAIDGSRITLPDTKELETLYGRTKNQNKTGVVQARVSVLYDVLNQLVIDGKLSSLSVGETKLALEHHRFCKKSDLIIYDRGYPSFDLVNQHYTKGINFLIRCKIDFNKVIYKFYQSGASSTIVKIYPGKNTKTTDKPYSKDTSEEVRLIRVVLSSGETEILMTSLTNVIEYPNSLFKDLYFLRWGIETFYDELKNKIKAEHFSGYSEHSILQDFYGSLFVSNIQSLIANEVNEELASQNSNKYQYKVNVNLSYGFMKDRIIAIFLSDKEMSCCINEIRELFKTHTIPIRPNRKHPRNVGKYRRRNKPKITKNQKDTI